MTLPSGERRREPPGADLQERVLATHGTRATQVATKAPQPRISELEHTSCLSPARRSRLRKMPTSPGVRGSGSTAVCPWGPPEMP